MAQQLAAALLAAAILRTRAVELACDEGAACKTQGQALLQSVKFKSTAIVREDSRRRFQELISETSGLPLTFEDLEETLDVQYGSMYNSTIYFYKPIEVETPEGGYQAVLVLHGMNGDKDGIAWWCQHISGTDHVENPSRVCAVINWVQVEGEQTEDIAQAITFFKENAETYEVNPEKIVLFGFSAGATLALEVVLTNPIAKNLQAAVIVSGIAPETPPSMCSDESIDKMLLFHSTEDKFLSYANVEPFLLICDKFINITFHKYEGSYHSPIKQPDFWPTIEGYLTNLPARATPWVDVPSAKLLQNMDQTLSDEDLEAERQEVERLTDEAIAESRR